MSSLRDTDVLRAIIREATSASGLVVGDFVCGYEITEENIVVLKDLVRLLLKTSFLWQESKDWLLGARSYRKVYASGQKERVNESTVRSRVYYDFTKIRALLGKTMAAEIFEADTEQLARLHMAIKKKIEKFDTSSVTKLFGIKVPECIEMVSELTERQKEELLFLCKNYSKKRIAVIESRIAQHIGYIEYLRENESDLAEQQREEWELIKLYLL